MAGGLVWNLDIGARLLLGFDPASHQQLFAINLPQTPANFSAPSAGAGHLLVADGSTLVAFNLIGTPSTVQPVFRLQKIPFHFFTVSPGERDSAISQFGWTLEGTAFCVPSNVTASLLPVYRLSKGNEFLYTFSAGERDGAVAIFGYIYEGVGFWANMSPGAGLTPVHRLNNGLEHIYLLDPAEIQQAIAQFGYRDEGVTLYAPACS
jgi:hypothetical protein